MFIRRGKSGYNRDGEQYAAGQFLILADHVDTAGGPLNFIKNEAGRIKLRAFVRHVHLRQFGHWMTGWTTLYDTDGEAHKIYCDGTYGSNGLPKDMPRKLWDAGVEVPDDMLEVFWSGEGGHNSAGSEGPKIRDWAQANYKALKAAGKKPKEKKSSD